MGVNQELDVHVLFPTFMIKSDNIQNTQYRYFKQESSQSEESSASLHSDRARIFGHKWNSRNNSALDTSDIY